MDAFKRIPKIKELPDDNTKRVVFANEGVYYNWYNSSIPLVGVLLVEVETFKGREQLSDRYIIAKIGVPEVDSARYGTMFLGKKRLKKNWKLFNGYRENLDFSFDFAENEPSSIHFGDKDPNGEYYIKYDRFSFSMINDKSEKAPFMKSRLAKLTTADDITVFIPTLEVLTSLLVPSERTMRSKLLMFPIDDVWDEYLKDYTYDTSNEMYVLDFKENGKSKTSMAFLAYLTMNQTSRNRMSKIGASIFGGNRSDIKYPEILPYHPTNLDISVDGIWLDNEKTVFLCFRVNTMMLPNDYKIGRIVEKEIKIGEPPEEQEEGEGGSSSPRPPKPDPVDLEVTAGNNPSKKGLTTYIKTEVDILSHEDLFVDIIIENKVDEPPSSSSKPSNKDQESEDEENDKGSNQVSSGDADNTNSSKGTGKLRQKDNLIKNPKKRVINSEILKNMILTLDTLKKDTSSILLDFSYLDNTGEKSSDGTLFDFTGSDEEKHRRWAHNVYDRENEIYEGRGALIIKVTLSNQRSAYILEIERRNDNEAFSGQLFNTEDGKLSELSIKELLWEIEKNNGTSNRRGNDGLEIIPLESVAENIPYPHREDKEGILYTAMFKQLLSDYKDKSIFK